MNHKLELHLGCPMEWQRGVEQQLRRTLERGLGWDLRLTWEMTDEPQFEITNCTSPDWDDALHEMTAQLVVIAFANVAAESSEDLLWARCSHNSTHCVQHARN